MTWTWWMTLLAIFVVLVLIGCIPVGVDARYSAEGVFLSAKIGLFLLQLLPQKPKKKKKQPKQQKKAEKAPAKAAMGYGRAWAAIGAITPSLERLFVIKKRDIRPALDYTISNTQVDAHLVTTITIGRSLALALRAGIRFLKILNERKKAV